MLALVKRAGMSPLGLAGWTTWTGVNGTELQVSWISSLPRYSWKDGRCRDGVNTYLITCVARLEVDRKLPLLRANRIKTRNLFRPSLAFSPVLLRIPPQALYRA